MQKSNKPGKPRKRSAGSKCGRVKAADTLRPAEVALLRDLFEFEFWSPAALAKKFEISEARVDSLVTYKTHR